MGLLTISLFIIVPLGIVIGYFLFKKTQKRNQQ